MRIDFHGLRDYVIEERFIRYARPRLEGLSHFDDRLDEVRVTVAHERGRYTVEITANAGSTVLRAETVAHEAREAFDEALDRIERQLVRYKERLMERRKRASHRGEGTPAAVAEEAAESEADEFPIVRVKTHPLKPMTPQEAILEMEMVGHDFYLFYNAETERVGVVYKRKAGGYGLIDPELGGE